MYSNVEVLLTKEFKKILNDGKLELIMNETPIERLEEFVNNLKVDVIKDAADIREFVMEYGENLAGEKISDYEYDFEIEKEMEMFVVKVTSDGKHLVSYVYELLSEIEIVKEFSFHRTFFYGEVVEEIICFDEKDEEIEESYGKFLKEKWRDKEKKEEFENRSFLEVIENIHENLQNEEEKMLLKRYAELMCQLNITEMGMENTYFWDIKFKNGFKLRITKKEFEKNFEDWKKTNK